MKKTPKSKIYLLTGPDLPESIVGAEFYRRNMRRAVVQTSKALTEYGAREFTGDNATLEDWLSAPILRQLADEHTAHSPVPARIQKAYLSRWERLVSSRAETKQKIEKLRALLGRQEESLDSASRDLVIGFGSGPIQALGSTWDAGAQPGSDRVVYRARSR